MNQDTRKVGRNMNQTFLASDGSARMRRRSAPHGARALLIAGFLLGGSLVIAGCATGSTQSSAPAASPAATPEASASAVIATVLQNDFVTVVNHVNPSVVVIETPTSLGSGIVFDANGDIVTNNHVVAGSSKFIVTLADGQKLAGKLVGTYPAGDLAVIHVTGTNLRPATFDDSSKLAVGDIVLAVGSPLGFQGTVTEGIVSALDRKVPESSTVTLPNVIQTSAEINPGNSGGALVDLAGNVVGIPTLTALDPQLGNTAAAGIGFAIPSNVVVDVAGQLIAHGRVVIPPTASGSAAPGASPAASASPTASASLAGS
jgi:S1-C subfamily serine protease